MPIIAIVGIVAAVVILLLIAMVASRPANFRVQRSALMPAPPSAIFPLISDFHQWARWSPWEHLDPNMKKTFGGPPVGVDSTYAWAGNKKAGEGKMTLLESNPNELVKIRIQFFKPFPADNTVTFIITPAQGGTSVQWIMEGRNNFMGKAFCLFVNMDKLVGGDFERGLANLSKESAA